MTIKDGIKQPWESHIDSLRHEEQWKEVMTIRSGHCQNFICRFNEVLQHFKRHRNPKRLRFEQRNPKTKERSYCDVHTPTGAPPKQNNQTEWNEETGNSRHKKASEQKKFRNPTSAEWWYNKRPDVFLKRRGVSTKTSGRFKKTSGFPKIGF